MDNGQKAPVIPAGTESMHNAVYNPLTAGYGQTGSPPDMGKSESAVLQASQSSTEEAPTGTTFEELAAKKGFKNADDLARSYSELESSKTRSDMALNELVKARFGDDTTPQRPAEVSSEELSRVQTQEEAVKVVEKIVRKVTAPLEDKLALQNLLFKNPDVQQYAGEMAKLVKENPGISWETAYKAAKFDQLEKSSREKGRQEAYQTIQQKQQVSVAVPRTSSKSDALLTLEQVMELVKDKNIPFREVQRIIKERLSQSR